MPASFISFVFGSSHQPQPSMHSSNEPAYLVSVVACFGHGVRSLVSSSE